MSDDKKDKAKKEKKRINVNFEGPAGTLQISAVRKDEKTVQSYVTHVQKDPTGKKTKTKGATESHTSMEAAKAAVEKLKANAIKAGWTEKVTGGKGKPKADAFDAAHIPQARK